MGGVILRSEAPPLFLLSIAGDSLPFSSFGGMGVYPHNRFSDYLRKEVKSGENGACGNARKGVSNVMCVINSYILKAIFTLSKTKIKNKGFCLIL